MSTLRASGIGPRELRRERSPDEVLHDEIELALFGLADVVDVDDVRVVDPIRGARFAQHPRAKVRFSAQIRADELERDDAIDEDVAGAIDDAHSAFTGSGFEAITTGDDPTKHRVDWFASRRNSLLLIHACSSAPADDDTEDSRRLPRALRMRACRA
ncbi:MAG: hypothetical protein U0235_06300 [Polyangiaceae bacterium]